MSGEHPIDAANFLRPAEPEASFYEAVERAKLAALAELAAGAAHEINNPLAVIAGRAQLLLREEADPERRRSLALIAAQAMRVHEMIADLMLFARPPLPEPQLLDAVAVVEGVVAQFAELAAERRITLCRRGEPGPIPLRADPAQLSVALSALCQNALEAVGPGGRVEITVRHASPAPTDGREVAIDICDDGPGITPQQRQHLFDPFYSAREAGRGLGLGLSKAWRIVSNHGGRIVAESVPGQGARFTVFLPAAPTASQPVAPTRGGTTSSSHERPVS